VFAIWYDGSVGGLDYKVMLLFAANDIASTSDHCGIGGYFISIGGVKWGDKLRIHLGLHCQQRKVGHDHASMIGQVGRSTLMLWVTGETTATPPHESRNTVATPMLRVATRGARLHMVRQQAID
jgi:hypothetical protein